MAEYIEREALEVALNHRLNFLMAENGEYDHYTSGFDEAVTRVENFPAADVAPVRHGRWVSVPHKLARVCSVCNRDEPYKFADIDADVYDYCPNCGAKMDGGAGNGC